MRRLWKTDHNDMRNFLAPAAALLLALGGHGALACDGKSEIEAAFAKQQKAPAWRTIAVSQGENGSKQEQTFEYIPPDRMYRKILIVGQEPAVETIGIAKWAYGNQGNGWSELQPPMAKMIAEHIQQVVTAPPKAGADFSCLGKVAYDGKDYLAYRTAPEKTDKGAELARTIYVDPATGLPAFNTIAEIKEGAEPLLKEAYTYPTDIVIEKPF
jgi:hypothetical protein